MDQEDNSKSVVCMVNDAVLVQIAMALLQYSILCGLAMVYCGITETTAGNLAPYVMALGAKVQHH